jgi:flagellar biosynthesis/type III secretory pathway protein FliH
MGARTLSSGEISELIDYLIKSKDPATVGLRTILKRKADQAEAFPLRSAILDEFTAEGKGGKRFSDDERIIMDLEKRVDKLKATIENQRREFEATLAQERKKSYTEGFNAGETAGSGKTATECGRTIENLRHKVHGFCAQLGQAQKAVFADAHSLLLAFCIEFSKKIIQTEVSLNPDIVLHVLTKALSYVADKERLVIKVAKDDWESASGKKDFWIPVGDKPGSVVIEADSRVEKGGCIVESNSGAVDARLGVQIAELTDIVRKEWESIDAKNESSTAACREASPDDAP